MPGLAMPVETLVFPKSPNRTCYNKGYKASSDSLVKVIHEIKAFKGLILIVSSAERRCGPASTVRSLGGSATHYCTTVANKVE